MTICILGNCQAQSIYKVLEKRGIVANLFLMNSLILNKNDRNIPAYEHDFTPLFDRTIGEFEQDGNIRCNPSLDDIAASNPSSIVMTMFHDSANYRHKEHGYFIYFNTKIYYQMPRVMNFIHSSFEPRKPCINNYEQHFKTLLETIRDRFPAIEIIVIKRLSPIILNDKFSFSWVNTWEKNYKEITSALIMHSKRLGVHIIDMDDIFFELRHEGCTIDMLFPNHVLIKKMQPGRETYSCRRDLEHVSEVIWHRLVDNVQKKLLLINPSDLKKEIEPVPSKKISTVQYLKSRNSQEIFIGIASLFAKLPINYTQLLIDNNDTIPVGKKNLLTIIRAYFLFNPNPLVPLWCDIHRKKAIEYWENEDCWTLEQRFYLKMIEIAKAQNGYYLNGKSKLGTPYRKKITADAFIFTYQNHIPILDPDYIELTKHSACQIYLWGAGGRGKVILKHFQKLGLEWRIIGFLDSNKEVDGQTIDGKPIIHYTKMPKHSQAAILICTTWEYEVLSILRSMMEFDNSIYLSSSFFDELDFTERFFTLELPIKVAHIPIE